MSIYVYVSEPIEDMPAGIIPGGLEGVFNDFIRNRIGISGRANEEEESLGFVVVAREELFAMIEDFGDFTNDVRAELYTWLDEYVFQNPHSNYSPETIKQRHLVFSIY